jgi:hypothetical protein
MNMMNSAVLLDTGMHYLSEKLGPVEAERFIALLIRESFDYTEWRKSNLFIGKSVMEISEAAKAYFELNPDE